MSLNREQYNSLLAQLAQNIVNAEDALARLKLQEKVSKFFLELNDSPTKMTCVPVSAFLSTIAASPGYFRYEQAGEMTFSVRRDEGTMTCSSEGCTTYFVGSELSDLCKDAQWNDDCCEIKLQCCRVVPAWTFPVAAPVMELTIPTVTPAVAETQETVVASTETPAESQSEPVPSVAN